MSLKCILEMHLLEGGSFRVTRLMSTLQEAPPLGTWKSKQIIKWLNRLKAQGVRQACATAAQAFRVIKYLCCQMRTPIVPLDSAPQPRGLCLPAAPPSAVSYLHPSAGTCMTSSPSEHRERLSQASLSLQIIIC